MMLKQKIFILLSVFLLLFVFINNNSIPTMSRYGSTGDEVKQIQTKLKELGYYQGKIDGIFKSQTQNAVKKFQSDNGLKVDGIAGEKTLEKLGISSGSPSVSSNENDTKMLAKIINAEARGEEYLGQVAVGAVVLNRVKHPSFPNSISGVIYQPGAFTAIVDGQWDAKMYDEPYRAAKDAMNNADPTNGAIYYYNPAKSTNKWIFSRPVVLKIGKHVFAK